MTYQYTDPTREDLPHALPDVEVFHCPNDYAMHDDSDNACPHGWYYAHGFPGCLWDSEPVGPFDTEDEALQAAREAAGTD